MMQLQLEQAQAAAAASAAALSARRRRAERPSAFLQRMEAQKAQKLGLNSWQRRLGPVITNRKKWKSLKRLLLGAAADEPSRKRNLLAAVKQAQSAFKMRGKAELQEVAMEFEAKVRGEEQQGTHRDCTVHRRLSRGSHRVYTARTPRVYTAHSSRTQRHCLTSSCLQ